MLLLFLFLQIFQIFPAFVEYVEQVDDTESIVEKIINTNYYKKLIKIYKLRRRNFQSVLRRQATNLAMGYKCSNVRLLYIFL